MRRTWLTGAALLVALPLATLLAADPPKKGNLVATEPDKAGPDFAIQGEYKGAVQAAAGAKEFGAQVVAEGDGKFTVRLLFGGLPGDGWDGTTQLRGNAKTEDGKVAVTGKDFSGSIADGKLTIKDAKLNLTLTKVERKSPTEGAKPPAGAVVLFDGTNADAWRNGKLVDGKYLNVGVYSKQSFRDFTLHAEFRLPFMPNARGQGRANSGVYLQNRYEIQVLDSFGLKGENNECGGIYQQYAPLVNMCYPPLSWQTYDVEFTAARFADGKKVKPAVATIKQNGVLIQDKVELKGPTGGGQKETDEPGPLQLQNHGNPVVFRNIWVVEKK